jgi:hypothetical protein
VTLADRTVTSVAGGSSALDARRRRSASGRHPRGARLVRDHQPPHQDLVGLSAVLRSWEERFGATLVWIGGFTLVLAVADPPRTREESERVAAEHFAFCHDQVDPQDGRDPYPTLVRTGVQAGPAVDVLVGLSRAQFSV